MAKPSAIVLFIFIYFAHYPITIQLQGPLKLTGVKQLECCCDPIRIINALRCIQRQQLTDNGLSKTTRVMTMNQYRKR